MKSTKSKQKSNENQEFIKQDKILSLQCHFCEKFFFDENILSLHVKALHQQGDEKLFSCETCEKSFKTKKYLHNHKRIVHEKNRNAICDTCGHSFPTKYSLKYHTSSVHNRLFVSALNLVQ